MKSSDWTYILAMLSFIIGIIGFFTNNPALFIFIALVPFIIIIGILFSQEENEEKK